MNSAVIPRQRSHRREDPPDERYRGTISLAPRIYEGGGPRSGRGSLSAAAGTALSVTAFRCDRLPADDPVAVLTCHLSCIHSRDCASLTPRGRAKSALCRALNSNLSAFSIPSGYRMSRPFGRLICGFWGIICTFRAFPWFPPGGTGRCRGRHSGRRPLRMPRSRPRRRGRSACRCGRSPPTCTARCRRLR